MEDHVVVLRSSQWQPNKINSLALGTMRRKGCLKIERETKKQKTPFFLRFHSDALYSRQRFIISHIKHHLQDYCRSTANRENSNPSCRFWLEGRDGFNCRYCKRGTNHTFTFCFTCSLSSLSPLLDLVKSSEIRLSLFRLSSLMQPENVIRKGWAVLNVDALPISFLCLRLFLGLPAVPVNIP